MTSTSTAVAAEDDDATDAGVGADAEDNDTDVESGPGVVDADDEGADAAGADGGAADSPTVAAGSSGLVMTVVLRGPNMSEQCLDQPFFMASTVTKKAFTLHESSQKSIEMGTEFHLLNDAFGPFWLQT